MQYDSSAEFIKSIEVCEATESILDEAIEKLISVESDTIIIEIIKTLKKETVGLLNLNLPIRK